MNKKQQRQQKMLRQQEIVNAAKEAGRDLTAEEQTEFDSLQREIERLNGEIEAEEQQQRGMNPPANAPPQNPANPEADTQRAIQEERARIRSITELCGEFGMEARSYIESGATLDSVREAALEHVRQHGAPIPANGRVSITESAEDKFRAAAADAIVMRSGMELQNPADGARQMMGMTLRDLAIECLTNEGQSGLNRRSSDELYGMLQRQFYNPTAAFPAILDNAINKAYVEGHKTVAVTFDQWTKKGTLKDFKTHDNNYLAGPVGEFLEVPEGGELKHDVFGDEKLPTRKLKTYGRQFTLTRQAFINDDIDLVTRIPAKYAASARKTQNKQCYQILVNNPAIYDGTVLFSSAHSNLLAKGTGITKEAVQGMILALQNQTDQFGEATIIRPAIIIVPSGYMFDMYTLFYSPTISTSGNTQAVNPLYRYKDSITVVEDPTINALCGGFGNVMPWWLLGAKDDTDFIEVDYLNGQEIPTIRRMETPGTLGFVWDIYLDWGISVMDYRGAIKKQYAYSAIFGALTAYTDASNDDVPNLSPSNKLIGITGLCLEDGTEVTLDQPQANLLNGQGIITAINDSGWKSWGNNTACYPANTDPKDRWFCCRRFFSWWGNSFILTYKQKVDEPGNYRLIESIVDSENIRGNSYVSQGKCAGARIEFSEDENPVTDILNGKIQFHQYLAPYVPAEDILNILEFDPDMLSAALNGGE